MDDEPIEVIPALSGGVGNQMFQIAMAHVFARQVGGVVAIDLSNFRSIGQGHPPSTYKDGLFSKLKTTSARPGAMRVHEKRWEPGTKPVLRRPPGVSQILIEGYWQLPALWECDHREIRDLFNFHPEKTARSGVHFRGGDYRWAHRKDLDPYHRQPGPPYFRRALEMLSSCPGFYTDDPELLDWLGSELGLPAAVCHPVPGSEEEHFAGMAGCAELVIPKSTFAWWAAFLGNVPLVVMPAAWFWKGEYQPSWAMRLDGWRVLSPDSALCNVHRGNRNGAEPGESPVQEADILPADWAPWDHPVEIINDLSCLTGARTYLEIGCGAGEILAVVDCEHKTAVNPSGGGLVGNIPLLAISPGEFFDGNRESFDLIFIGPMEDAAQFGRALIRADAALTDKGILICAGLKNSAAHWHEWLRVLAELSHRGAIAVDTAHGIGVLLPVRTSGNSPRLTWNEDTGGDPRPAITSFVSSGKAKNLAYELLFPGRQGLPSTTAKGGASFPSAGKAWCPWLENSAKRESGAEAGVPAVIHPLLDNQFDFHVREGQVRVEALRQYESRGDACLEMLHRLVAKNPGLFEGRESSVFYEDRPPPDAMARRELNFCTTIRAGHPGPWLPFPCFTSLFWPQIGVPDAEVMMNEMLADESPWESTKLFWIGTDQHPSRRALWELGKRRPEILDIEMMEWNRTNPGLLVSQSRQVSIPDHRKFKYLIDCPGRGYSARLKWLLATGRPVFIVDREIVEPWHVELRPWVHFVPVAADLSDLLEHRAKLEHDPDLYAEIADNTRNFAARRLTVDSQLEWIVRQVADRPGEPRSA